MPLHMPKPRNDPPSIRDRARVHSSDLWLTVMAVDLGLIVLAAGSIIIRTMDPWVSLALGGVILSGGILAAWGLLWTGRTVSYGWTMEQAGWWLIASAWFSYTLALAVSSPKSFVVWSLTAILGLAAVTRALIVRGIEREGRATAESKARRG